MLAKQLRACSTSMRSPCSAKRDEVVVIPPREITPLQAHLPPMPPHCAPRERRQIAVRRLQAKRAAARRRRRARPRIKASPRRSVWIFYARGDRRKRPGRAAAVLRTRSRQVRPRPCARV